MNNSEAIAEAVLRLLNEQNETNQVVEEADSMSSLLSLVVPER
jgi:hypothetical protein